MRPARTPLALAGVRPWRARIDGRHGGEPTDALRPDVLAWPCDRRQRAVPRRRARRLRHCDRTTSPACARRPTGPARLRLGRPARARRARSWTPSPTSTTCTRWPSRTPSSPTSAPSSSATTTRCSWCSRRSGTSTRTTPSRPARSASSSARSSWSRCATARAAACTTPGMQLEGMEKVLAHGPSAVVYADLRPGGRPLRGGRRRRSRRTSTRSRSRCSPTAAHQRLRAASTCSSASSPRCAARCCRCASR